jgi:hypothetical protein
MDNEVWKDVKGFEGLYRVSNFGRVYSLHTYNKRKLHLRKPSWNKSRDYFYIELFNHQKSMNYRLHKLVALHFIENINNYPILNHKDGNKRNNKVTNLEWCTYKQNVAHAMKMGLMNFVNGEAISKKLKEKDIHKIFELKSERKTHEQISILLNIPVSTIAHIALHNNWKYIKIDKKILEKIEANKHRWALKYDRCIKCKRDDIDHNAKGLCENCYSWGIKNNKLLEIIKKYERPDTKP